jgi:hypothetical protein
MPFDLNKACKHLVYLNGLAEDEFACILTTFPLVPDPVKIAAHNAYKNIEKGLIV